MEADLARIALTDGFSIGSRKSAKPRLFYLAWTPPLENGGACLAMHRHFVQHDDFDLFVASSTPFEHPVIPSLRVNRHPGLVRISNTRFSRWVRQFEMIMEPARIPAKVLEAARRFKPDAIFTVPDNTLSWTAYKLARKMGIPLITNFQDWWPRGQFTLELEQPYAPVVAVLERRFRRLYQASSLAFCTSAGMKEFLGPHPNAPVLYPCPARRDPDYEPAFNPPPNGRPLRLIYAGTVVNSYGRSVLRLAKLLRGRPGFEFHVYGPHPDWVSADLAQLKADGVYRGLVSHEALKGKLQEADICLVVMSFEERLKVMMRTSFTTKFLEYCQYAKPVVVWGPEYCQPVKVAEAHGAGVAVTEDSEEAVFKAVVSLQNPGQWEKFAQGAWTAAEEIFNPERIQSVFCESIYRTLGVANPSVVNGGNCR